MIPLDAIIGLRFTQEHPFVTGVVIAVLIALAILAASRSRRSTQQKKALSAVSLALVIGAAGFFSWAYNTRGPGLFEHAAKAAKFAHQVAAEQAAKPDAVETEAKSGETHNCTTTGPNSPIVTGKNSVVVVNGKTYLPGQSADCTPGPSSISTHGAGSPIVTGSGAKVTSVVEP